MATLLSLNPPPHLKELMGKIRYTFNDPLLLEQALIHSSYANERKRPIPSNERLEFLGDSVLELITAYYLFENHDGDEGELTKTRAMLVCEKALFSYAMHLDLGKYMKLGKGESRDGGVSRPSILADAFEAITAAIYHDGGMKSARAFVMPFIMEELKNQKKPKFFDYKTTLQEIIQQNPEEKLSYQLDKEEGPDHDKLFFVHVLLNSNIIGKGIGKSKKEAEQTAAKEALNLMGH